MTEIKMYPITYARYKELLQVHLENKNHDARQAMKTLAFGIVYGATELKDTSILHMPGWVLQDKDKENAQPLDVKLLARSIVKESADARENDAGAV